MIPRRAFLAIAAVSASAGLLAVAVRAEEPQVYATDGVAINGYDPVAYFTEGAPVKGSEQITHDWNGATWQFASAENRDAFAADPTPTRRNMAAIAPMPCPEVTPPAPIPTLGRCMTAGFT